MARRRSVVKAPPAAATIADRLPPEVWRAISARVGVGEPALRAAAKGFKETVPPMWRCDPGCPAWPTATHFSKGLCFQWPLDVAAAPDGSVRRAVACVEVSEPFWCLSSLLEAEAGPHAGHATPILAAIRRLCRWVSSRAGPRKSVSQRVAVRAAPNALARLQSVLLGSAPMERSDLRQALDGLSPSVVATSPREAALLQALVDLSQKGEVEGEDVDAMRRAAILAPYLAWQSRWDLKVVFIMQSDRALGLRVARVDDGFLRHANEVMRSDRLVVTAAVKKRGMQLESAAPSLQDDFAVVLAAVQQDGHALRDASAALKNDGTIVLAAVQQNGYSLGYASDTLRNDRKIVLAAVLQSGEALQYARGALKNDGEIVLAAVGRNGNALRCASAALQNDGRIVLAAVRHKGEALQHASAALQNDGRIVLAAVQQNGEALQHASTALRNDGRIVLAAVQQNGEALRYASDALRNDDETVLAAVMTKDWGWPLKFASPRLRQCLPFARRVVGLLPSCYQYFPEDMRSDRDLALAAVRQAAFSWQDVPVQLLRDRAFALACVRYRGALLEKLKEFQDDSDVVRAAVEHDGRALRFASPRLRDDGRIVRAAVRNCGRALRFASAARRADRDIVLEAVFNDGRALRSASKKLQDDFVLQHVALHD